MPKVPPQDAGPDERSNPQGKPNDLVPAPIVVGKTRRLVPAVEPEIADSAQRHGEVPEHPERRSHPTDDTNRPKRGYKRKRRRREKRKPEVLRIEISVRLRPAPLPRQPPLCVRRPALGTSGQVCDPVPSKRISATPAAMRGLAAWLAEMFGVGAHALIVILFACCRHAVMLTPVVGGAPCRRAWLTEARDRDGRSTTAPLPRCSRASHSTPPVRARGMTPRRRRERSRSSAAGRSGRHRGTGWS
jgi:hypothetical protein